MMVCWEYAINLSKFSDQYRQYFGDSARNINSIDNIKGFIKIRTSVTATHLSFRWIMVAMSLWDKNIRVLLFSISCHINSKNY